VGYSVDSSPFSAVMLKLTLWEEFAPEDITELGCTFMDSWNNNWTAEFVLCQII